MEEFQSKVLASDDNGTPEAHWQYGGLSEQSTGIRRRCGEPSEQRSAPEESKVMAWEDDGIPKALWQIWRTFTFRTKYWHWKMTVSQKLFGKYQEDLQREVLEWEDNGTPEALWQIWRTFRAKYWHGKMTVSRKLFGKYGGPSEPSTGMGRRWYLRSSLANMEDFHFQNKVLALEDDGIPEALWQIAGGPSERMGRRRYPRSSSAVMEDLQRKVLEWEDDGTPDALQHQKDPQSNVLALEDDGTPEVLWQIRRTLRAKNWPGGGGGREREREKASKALAWEDNGTQEALRKYGGSSGHGTGMGRRRYPGSSSAIWRILRAKYWHMGKRQ